MKELIEEYLFDVMAKYKPRVIIYNLGINVIDVEFKDAYDDLNTSKEQISVWELLEFVYNKTKQ